MEDDSTANEEFLARFQELLRTEDQSSEDSENSSQNHGDYSVAPDAQFSTSLNQNTIWAWHGLRNAGINLLNSLRYFSCLTIFRRNKQINLSYIG